MLLGMLKKAFVALKQEVYWGLPFFGPPMDKGLSLLSKRACQNAGAGSYFPAAGSIAAQYPKVARGRWYRGKVGMSQAVDQIDAEKILETAIEQNIPAIMSYLSKGKWHVAKVVFTELGGGRLSVRSAYAQARHPINIQVAQPVGVSFKYEYGKYVFDSTVVALEPSSAAGGIVVLAAPRRVEVIQRRSYFRVQVPQSLKVEVTLWHRKSRADGDPGDPGRYRRGRLVDISAGGAQVMLDRESAAMEPQFKQGAYIGMRFTPLPYETPLLLNAQIRNILPRAGGDSIYLGLQIVGLEASIEGRQTLARLVGIVERYHKMNQTAAKRSEKAGAQA